ncbi:MAG: class I SAM-dependent methyltransferase [Marinicaulis sp.]|nr:class I SAM-dependent methyltransferase [Marinicaulis sp.]
MANCVLCGGEMVDWLACPIDAKTFEPTPYGNAKRCEICDLGRIDPLPAPEELDGFYKLDAYYTHGETHFAAGAEQNFFDRVRDNIAWRFDKGDELDPASIIAKTGKPANELSVLDIGCGHGSLLKKFKALGAAAAGLEPDPEAGAALTAAGIDWYQGVGEAAPESLTDRTFDIVAMTHSLEHCIDPVKALQTAHSLLTSGGIFICETPNCACLHFERTNIFSEMYDAPRHLHFFTPKSLSAMIKHAGFDVTGEYYLGFVRHFQNGWRATENRIREKIIENSGPTSSLAPEYSRSGAMKLLLKTASVSPAKKYDCVGFYATRS